MREYTKPAVSEFPLNLISMRLQATGETPGNGVPLTGTNCTGCLTFGLQSLCAAGNDNYRFNLILENTTCAAAALDVSSCTITVGSNVFNNCTPGNIPQDVSCAQGSLDCQVLIECFDTLTDCQLSDVGATVEIDCPGFEVCSTNLGIT